MTCAGRSLADLYTVADPLPRRHGSDERIGATASSVAAVVGPSRDRDGCCCPGDSAGIGDAPCSRRGGGRSDTGQLGHDLGSARFRLSHEQAEELQGPTSERTRVGGQLQ
jgi:hypothetical protein